jgi:hypothetical protein
MHLLSVICFVSSSNMPVDSDRFARNLVQMSLTPELLVNASTQVSSRHNGVYTSKVKEVIGFITSRRPIGYDLSLAFGARFTTVVPLWFAGRFNTNYSVTGVENVNQTWLNAFRLRYPRVRIAPRLRFKISVFDFVHNYKQASLAMKEGLEQMQKMYKFDGFFLEFPEFFTELESAVLVPELVKIIRKALPELAEYTQIFRRSSNSGME